MLRLVDFPVLLRGKIKKKLGIKKTKRKKSRGLSQENLHSFIMKTLRKLWCYQWPARKMVLQKAKVSHGYYKCDDCLKVIHKSNIEVHHIEPVATHNRDYNLIIMKLFCDEGGLKVLCKTCHALY